MVNSVAGTVIALTMMMTRCDADSFFSFNPWIGIVLRSFVGDDIICQLWARTIVYSGFYVSSDLES